MLSNRVNFSEITSKYLGARYKLGGWSKEEGMDCFSVIISIMRDMGAPLTDDIDMDGINTSNYVEKFKKDNESLMRAFKKFARHMGTQLEPSQVLTGDIIIVIPERGERRSEFVGIYGGNDKVITASPFLGVVGMNLRYYKIVEVYRFMGWK